MPDVSADVNLDRKLISPSSGVPPFYIPNLDGDPIFSDDVPGIVSLDATQDLNLDNLRAAAEAAASGIGNPGNSAWPAAGNATLISLLKHIALQQLPAPNMYINTVATATTAGGDTVIAARAGRRSVLIKNIDAAITIYLGVGGTTVAAGANGLSIPLLAGESITLFTAGAIDALAASGTPLLSYVEHYD